MKTEGARELEFIELFEKELEGSDSSDQYWKLLKASDTNVLKMALENSKRDRDVKIKYLNKVLNHETYQKLKKASNLLNLRENLIYKNKEFVLDFMPEKSSKDRIMTGYLKGCWSKNYNLYGANGMHFNLLFEDASLE